MTEVDLIVPEKDLLAVTGVLAGQGTFHQVDAGYLSSKTGPDPAGSWSERAAAYTALERRILATMKALDVEEGPPLLAERASMIEVEVARPLVEQIEQEVGKASEQLADVQKRLERLVSYVHQLEPIAGIALDVGALRHPRYLFSMLGVIPVANRERLQTSLARIPFVLLTLRQDGQKAVVWLVGTQRNADILDRAARSAYLNPLDLPDIHQGTPSEVISSLHTAIERARQHIADQKAAMTQLHEAHQRQLQALLWHVRTSRMLADAIAHYGRLRYTYLIVGWVPSSDLAVLSQRLKQASSEALIEANPSRRGGAKSNVPVALHNPGVLGAFQQLVTTYARPRYEEVDPTWLIALTFPLLFGAMFGDVGHGLVLALLGGLVASRRVRALRRLASLGTIIVVCGLAATLFGFLYGSVFGVENVLPALWIQPMDNIMQILTMSIGTGVILLSVGFLLGILNAWRTRDWGRLLFDHNGVAGFVLYWSLIGLVAGTLVGGFPIPPLVFVLPAVGAGLAVMFSEVLEHLVERRRPLTDDGLGTYAVQAVFELFETLISFLSNSLSYVRVGAFAVAHGGLSAVVFILAEMAGPGHGVGYWVVVAVGNVFIVGFEGLIVGIQTMRLEYYEFFSKFFTGGGVRFEPLTLPPTSDK
ncbi:MAG: V-type ATPase 116kDa subunit family protein [Anaerolineae bacterium]